jgi:hypothetical protein
MTSVPLNPHGDSQGGSAGACLPLSPTSFLAPTIGPDDVFSTADDEILLVTSADMPTPTITPIVVPYQSNYSGHVTRLSATRALVIGAGPDGKWSTDDDVVNLLDDLGASNTVTPITVGNLDQRDGYAPEALSANSAALSSRGADHLENTADDVVVILSDLGGRNFVSPISAPFLSKGGRSRPEPLTPTSFLLASAGPDGKDKTADDVVYLFTGAGSINQRTDLAVPYLFQNAPGRPVRVNATRALVSSCGPDAVETSADDHLVLLDGLGTTNTVTDIATGSLSNYGAGRATPLSDEVAVLSTPGVDNKDITADDGYLVVTNLSTTHDVQTIPVGGLDEDNGTHATRLAPDLCAFVTSGPNFKFGSSGVAGDGLDDRVAILKLDAAGVGSLTYVNLPGMDPATTSVVVGLSSDAILVGGGGDDGRLDFGLDDTMSLITDLRSAAPVLDTVALNSDLGSSRDASVSKLLGGGRAVFVVTGPDGNMRLGKDDEVRILSGLPASRDLHVKKASIRFSAAKPEKGETLAVSGTLTLDEPALITTVPVTISIGRAAQTLPAGSFVAKKRGVYEYADKKGALGFLRKITWSSVTRKLTISGKGVATRAALTSPDYFPVAFDTGDLYLSTALAATVGKSGITYKE